MRNRKEKGGGFLLQSVHGKAAQRARPCRLGLSISPRGERGWGDRAEAPWSPEAWFSSIRALGS